MDRFKCPRLRKPLFLSATLFGEVSTLSMVYVGQAIEDDTKMTTPNMAHVGQTIDYIKMTTLSMACVGQAIEDN